MKKFLIEETRINNLFHTDVYQNCLQDIPEVWVPKCYNALFMTMAHYCALRKTKEEPVAIVLRDLKDNFKIAMIVKYNKIENEETNDKGNWSLVMTFDEKDLKNAKKYYTTDSSFNYLLAVTSKEMYNFMYGAPELVPKILEKLIEYLLVWLNEEAVIGEQVSVESEGFFVAQVEVNGDKKILGITPGENLKNAVKADVEL